MAVAVSNPSLAPLHRTSAAVFVAQGICSSHRDIFAARLERVGVQIGLTFLTQRALWRHMLPGGRRLARLIGVVLTGLSWSPCVESDRLRLKLKPR